jgi:hypothetical protein
MSMGLQDRRYMKGREPKDPSASLNESSIERRLREGFDKHRILWIGLLVLVIGAVLVAVLLEKM